MKRPSIVARFMAGESAWKLAKERCVRLGHIEPALTFLNPCGRCENAIETVFRRALGPVPRAKKVRRGDKK